MPIVILSARGTQKFWAYFLIDANRVEVIANLPVRHKAPESNGIICLEMPQGGKILTAMYTGPYGNIRKVHKSLQQYIRDKSLRKIALSYEKFFSDPLPANDSTIVKVQVCYPVF